MKKITKKRLGEIVGLGEKTLKWLHDNVLRQDSLESKQIFYEEDISTIQKLQIGIFDVENALIKIPGYDDYWVAPTGKFYTYHRKFFEEFKGCVNKRNGYCYVNLFDKKSCKHRTYRAHRLIAELFIPNPDNKPVVNHIDGNKINNSIENLEWATVSENIKHAFDNNLAHNDKGIDDSQSMPIIVSYDNGDTIKYGSCYEAERETGISRSTFLRLARNHRHSRKYDFKVSFSAKEAV